MSFQTSFDTVAFAKDATSIVSDQIGSIPSAVVLRKQAQMKSSLQVSRTRSR